MPDEETSKKVMLIVDDMLTNRLLLKKIFSPEYQIEEAVNGREALEKLQTLPEVSVLILDIFMPELDGFGVLTAIRADERFWNIPIVVVTSSNDEETQIRALADGATDVLTKPFSPQIILHRINNIIARKEADQLAEQNRAIELELKLMDIDEKSGLYNKRAFIRYASRLLQENPHKKYVIMRWDIDNFKTYNDCFGTEMGDDFLRKVGNFYNERGKDIAGLCLYARYEADHFVCCREAKGLNPDELSNTLENNLLLNQNSTFKYIPRIGFYRVEDPNLDVSLMCDRALLALRSVKNDYEKRYAWYDEAMREALVEEQEIVNEMEFALKAGQFEVYLQPQYNHDTGSLIGAEALVRWNHPAKGLIPPIKFIPLFERNGFISKLDEYVWEQTCILLRKWLDEGNKPIPISVNVSRRDIYKPNLCQVFLNLFSKYNLDPSLLHLEITETAYTQNAEQLLQTVNQFRQHGIKVHMDDFGSGYSSLNTLKNVPVDMLKLDMKFLGSDYDDDRSGSILNAVVRMANALKLPILAEGVETKEQADFLKSIGCLLMQGYYFSRPVPIRQFEEIMFKESVEPQQVDSFIENIKGSVDLLSPSMQSVLLFNSFIGGAGIVEYHKKNQSLTALRINDQYLKELGSTRTEYAARSNNILEHYVSPHKENFIAMLDKAVKTGQEASCEVLTSSPYSPAEEIWLRLRVRFLAESAGHQLIYLAIENINQRKELMQHNQELTERLSTIISSIPGGVMNFEIKGQEVRTTFINEQMADMSGYTKEEFLQLFGENSLATVHPEDQARLQANIAAVLKGEKKLLRVKYRHICKNGSWRWVQIFGGVMRWEQERILTTAVVIDIEDQMQVEKNKEKSPS